MRLLKQVVPALLVGIFSALVLLLIDLIAEHWLHELIWSGNRLESRWWIFIVLTCAGIAVGLIVWLMPGHAGPDPATVDLMHKPGPLIEVPSLLLAATLALAAGVSLGPEFPVLGANAAIAVAIGARFAPRVEATGWAGLATAGTIGALFGAPIAAALVLTEAFAQAPSKESLWDRLFAPIAAGAAGSLTALALSSGTSLTMPLPGYPGFEIGDIATGCLVAVAAAGLGLVAIWVFPWLWRGFQRLRHPLLILTAGGVLLGVLGAIGGEITMFKGLEQMQQLAQDYTTRSAGDLASITAIKIAALLIAATSGFRGGRIFPAVFAALAFGLLVNGLFPGVPVALAVACSVLGFVLPITRSGWLAIFLAAVIVPSPLVLVILTVAVLPAWLLVTGAPEMKASATVTA